ncbi:MAG: hypothetical protein EA397_07285 [Deltaproteobacteria bacterium]|nr:MAG: hypothetical protein EA397_07285 [Deltaproteobacteria bacterium]
MGSDLYRVKVSEIQTNIVSLLVEVVHPDSNYVSENPGFALMLLHEGARDDGEAALNAELSFDDLMDRSWVEKYAKGFIEMVSTSVVAGSSDGEGPEDWIKAKVEITVTDPAWIEHFNLGQSFDSRAYDLGYAFQDHPPIHPGQIDPNAPVPEAFVALPGALFGVPDVPTVIRAAAYSGSSYRCVDEREGTFKPEELQDLDGRVVLYQGKWDSSMQPGFLYIAGENIYLLTASNGSHGSSSSKQFEGKIGLAELIPGKRLGAKLKVGDMIRRMQPRILRATVEADVARFTISLPPGGPKLVDLDAEQLPAAGFLLLMSPLAPTSTMASPRTLEPSKLSWTIEREVLRLFDPKERQITKYIGGEMVPSGDTLPQDFALAQKLSLGFVAKAEIASQPDMTPIDFDALTEAEQAEILGEPWPELVLDVTPHHAAYLEHLTGAFEPRELPHIPRPDPWEGDLPEPASEPTGFGEVEDPTEEVPKGLTAPASEGGAIGGGQAGGPNKILIVAGVAVGAVLLLSVIGFGACCCLPMMLG